MNTKKGIYFINKLNEYIVELYNVHQSNFNDLQSIILLCKSLTVQWCYDIHILH